MTPNEASEVGVYAGELFRYVTYSQKQAVAELVMQIQPLKDETGAICQPALDVGKLIVRVVAATAGDEQRLHLADIAKAVSEHVRRTGDAPVDHEKSRRTSEREATIAARLDDAAAIEWAENLAPDEAEHLTREALAQIDENSRYLFRGKTLLTSKTLRALALEHDRKLKVFK